MVNVQRSHPSRYPDIANMTFIANSCRHICLPDEAGDSHYFQAAGQFSTERRPTPRWLWVAWGKKIIV